jgi:transketolase
MPWLNRVDREWFFRTVRAFSVIFTIDNHYIKGGLGEMAGMSLAVFGCSEGRKLVCLGVEDVPYCGRNDEVLMSHGLDSESIVRVIREYL